MSDALGQPFDFEGRYGKQYEGLTTRAIPGYREVFQAALALLAPRTPADAEVLVVGTGTGMEVATFGPAMPGWRFTAVDPAAEMLKVTRSRATALGLDSRLTTRQGYVSDLPAASRFDAATIMNVVHFLPDDGAKGGLFRDVATRLKPGGSVTVLDLHGDPSSAEYRVLRPAWEAFQVLRGLAGAEQEEFLDRIARGIHWVPERRLRELWEAAGLQLEVKFYQGLLYGAWLLRR